MTDIYISEELYYIDYYFIYYIFLYKVLKGLQVWMPVRYKNTRGIYTYSVSFSHFRDKNFPTLYNSQPRKWFVSRISTEPIFSRIFSWIFNILLKQNCIAQVTSQILKQFFATPHPCQPSSHYFCFSNQIPNIYLTSWENTLKIL